MRAYWLPDRGTAEHFWEHEWRKHGTCINTLAPACYGEDYSEGDEVVDFFTRAVEIFKVRFYVFEELFLAWETVFSLYLWSLTKLTPNDKGTGYVPSSGKGRNHTLV